MTPKEYTFDAAYQPQVRAKRGTREIMLDVIIALLPALCVGVWQFGAQALIPLAVSIVSCVFFEWVYRKLMKKPESYRLACAYHQINLLSILEALGEGVYFNRPSDEKFYSCYGTTARKLGIVNQMTRLYLMEISIAELPVSECFIENSIPHI